MKIQSPKRKRIALLVETSLGSGREILRGISQYARQIDDWEIFHTPSGLGDAIPEWLESWQGDGVIARIRDEKMLNTLRRLNTPVVDVLGVTSHEFPLVHVNDEMIAQRVARHFLGRDFNHFAFYGIRGEHWSERRETAFRMATKGGLTFACTHYHHRKCEGAQDYFSELQRWLLKLPKPVAIMVCSDQLGFTLLEACRAANLTVPEQVAVVGVDNDLAICEVAKPHLSSVRGGNNQVGYEAAYLLNRLMSGDPPPPDPIIVRPNEVVTRESSDSRCISDPAVRAAVQFIREHLSDAITNDKIAKAAGISKTRLQIRFRDAVGMTLNNFLGERRLHRAENLIRSTDLTFADIAECCGFRHHEYLGHVLKRKRGVTPKQLRSIAGSSSSLQPQ